MRCQSRIRIFSIPDPRPDPQHCIKLLKTLIFWKSRRRACLVEDMARCPCMVSVYSPTWVLLTYNTIHISHLNICNKFYRTLRGLLSQMVRDKSPQIPVPVVTSYTSITASVQSQQTGHQGRTSYAAKKTPGLNYTGLVRYRTVLYSTLPLRLDYADGAGIEPRTIADFAQTVKAVKNYQVGNCTFHPYISKVTIVNVIMVWFLLQAGQSMQQNLVIFNNSMGFTSKNLSSNILRNVYRNSFSIC